MDDPTFEDRSPRDGSAPEPNRVPPPKLDVLGRATVARRPLEQLTVEAVEVTVLGIAQPDRALDDGLEDRLDVGRWSWLITRRISAGGRLLLQRLASARDSGPRAP